MKCRNVPAAARALCSPRSPCIPIAIIIKPICDIEEHASVRFKLTENTARTAPITIVIRPSISIMLPHAASCRNSLQLTTITPNTPVFVSRQESSALDGAGATVYAPGSQIWSGNNPAFAPKPNNIKTPTIYNGFLSGCACMNTESSFISSVPAIWYIMNSPINVTKPPITATARYVCAERMEISLSSWITSTKDVKDMISKKISVVNKSAERKIPIVAPSVRNTKK